MKSLRLRRWQRAQRTILRTRKRRNPRARERTSTVRRWSRRKRTVKAETRRRRAVPSHLTRTINMPKMRRRKLPPLRSLVSRAPPKNSPR
jgi:hypothetical protein